MKEKRTTCLDCPYAIRSWRLSEHEHRCGASISVSEGLTGLGWKPGPECPYNKLVEMEDRVELLRCQYKNTPHKHSYGYKRSLEIMEGKVSPSQI